MVEAGYPCIVRSGAFYAASGRTIFIKASPFSGNGFIERFCVYFAGSAAGKTCKLKVFRQNGSDIDFIAESPSQSISSAIRYTFDIPRITVQSGDYIGLYFTLPPYYIASTAPTGEGIYYIAGDITANTPESNFIYFSGGYSPSLKAFGVSFVKTTGNDALDGESWANAFATVDKAATTVPDGTTVHIGFGTYNAEPANNDIAPVNAGAIGIKYLPETATTGGGTGSVIVEVN